MAGVLADVGPYEAAIVAHVNATRGEAHLAPLAVSPALAKAARDYAHLLAASGQFSHTADATFDVRATRAGYQACAVAENLALRREGALTAMTLAWSTIGGWLASPAHHHNLMEPGMTQTGVGVAIARAKTPGDAPTFLVVELFARPQAQRVSFRIENQTSAPVSLHVAGKPQTVSARTTLKLSACAAPTIAFERVGSTLVSSRYEASDGLVLRVTATAGGDVRVEASHR